MELDHALSIAFVRSSVTLPETQAGGFPRKLGCFIMGDVLEVHKVTINGEQ